MDAEIHRDGYCYTLHFEKGENIGGLHKEPYHKRDTGSRIRWKPDIQVFTDINIPRDWFVSTMKRQAIVNDGVHFVLKEETAGGKFNNFVTKTVFRTMWRSWQGTPLLPHPNTGSASGWAATVRI